MMEKSKLMSGPILVLGLVQLIKNLAFYVWADVSALCPSSIDFCNDLLEKKTLITIAGSHLGAEGEGFIRLALVKSMEVLAEAMDRMESYVSELDT